MTADCELCREAGGEVIVRTERWRVVRVPDPDFPAFYRVIWNAHVREFTDLAPAGRAECMEVVARVERVLRDVLAPTKVNLASLGNLTPHLHWHVIARFEWDSRFPGPIWGSVQREAAPAMQARIVDALSGVDDAVRVAVGGPT